MEAKCSAPSSEPQEDEEAKDMLLLFLPFFGPVDCAVPFAPLPAAGPPPAKCIALVPCLLAGPSAASRVDW
jgi:hypothetical protein